MALRSAVILTLLTLGACGDDEAPTGRPAPSERAAEDSAEDTPVRPFFDLAAHVQRAELREGDVLVQDHGLPGGAKYTLGGWQTRVGPHREIGATPALVFPGVTGKIVLPIERPGRHEVLLRMRAFGDGRLTVYLDDETVHHASLPRDRFELVRIPLPRVAPGEHFLSFRVPRAGFAEGVGRAALALDWVRIAPEGSEGLDVEPPRGLAGTAGEHRTLRLPNDVRLGWTLDVPEGARLRAVRRGEGRLRVSAVTDGAAPPPLAIVDGTRVDVDLSALAGRVARLDLEATGGDVELVAPMLVLPGDPTEPRTVRRPRNVLVYLVDTLRADKLRAYAPETRVRTPGLDAWVAGATVLTRGQSQENWTKPSVATLLTGLLPWEHRATTGDAALPGSVRMLSEQLRDRGFHTGAFVANGYVSTTFGFRQGWSTWRNYIREGRRTQASFVAADVLAWLDDRPEDRPFFLYVHTIDPHVPYMPPADVLRSYDPDPYDGPVDFGRDRETLEKIKTGAMRLGPRDRTRLEALYDGEITYHDTHFHSIVEGLERRGLADDTLVVFTSDHGEEFFDHGSVGHGHSVWQELLHVPLIVRVPGLTDGDHRIDETVGLVDVVPTVLEALGEEVPGDVTGRSFLELLRGGDEHAPRVSVSGFMRGWRTVVTGRHKLVHRTAARTMVYDLDADAEELDDVAASRPLTVRWLRGLLGLALAGELYPEGRTRVEHEAERVEIDAETEAQLRELGYVGASRPE